MDEDELSVTAARDRIQSPCAIGAINPKKPVEAQTNARMRRIPSSAAMMISC